MTEEGAFHKYFHALWHFETVRSEMLRKCQGFFLGKLKGRKAGKYSWPATETLPESCVRSEVKSPFPSNIELLPSSNVEKIISIFGLLGKV